MNEQPSKETGETLSLTFRFPKSFRRTMLLCSLCFLAFVSLGISLPFLGPMSGLEWLLILASTALFLPLSIYSFWVFSLSNDYLIVDDSGLRHVSHGREKYLSWSEISRLGERSIGQRWELYDTSGRKTIRVEYQLENINLLLDLIIAKTRHLAPMHARRKVFLRERLAAFALLVLGIIFFGLAWFFYAQDKESLVLVFAAVSSLLVLFLLISAWKIEIGSHGIIISSLLYKQEIPYSRISDILIIRQVSNQQISSSVMLKLNDESFKRFVLYQDGSLPLFDALFAAWKEHKTM